MPFFLAALLWIYPAFAGAVLVPMAPIPADGETTSTVRLYLSEVVKPRIKVDGAKVGPISVGADGIASFPLTPAAVGAPANLTLKVTTGNEDSELQLAVVPRFSGAIAISFEPALLPSTQTATVKITPSGGTPVAASQRRLVVRASLGTLDALAPVGDGTWVARYTPPKGMTDPAVVAITAADAAAPHVYGVAALPVTVRRSVTFDAQSGSQNVFEIGGRSFGPATASPAGKVAIDLDLDPRVSKGIQRIVNADTSKSTKEVDIPGAAKPQLVFLPLPGTIPADGSLKVTARVVAISGDGTISAPTTLTMTASRGSTGAAVTKGSASEVPVTPPTTAGDLLLTASADGAQASATIKVVAGLPTLTLVADPPQIAKAGKSVSVSARLKDSQGTGLAGRSPGMKAEGGTASSPKDNKDGTYTTSVSVSTSTARVRVYATPPVEASANGPVRVLAWPSAPTVNANGKDQVVVTIVAVDAFDLPVPDVEFRLGVPRLDGGVPPTVKADRSGVARVVYTAGSTEGMSGVRVEGAGLVAETPIFQTKQGVAALAAPSAGAEWDTSLARWQGAAPTLVVDREGAVAPAGPPVAVQITTVPGYTTPGAAILVQVRVVDANGFGVGGQKLEVAASPAAVGAITDNKDGSYNMPIQLPAGTDGPITVTIKAGAAVGSVLLPKLGDAGIVARTSAPLQSGGGGSSGSTGQVKQARPTSADGPGDGQDWRVRLLVALTNAHGSFTQTSDGGDLLVPSASYGTAAAGFWGADVKGEGYFVDASFGQIGAELRGHAELQLFGVADETVVRGERDLIAGLRYRKMVGATWLGGGVGFHYSTAPVFRYPDDTRTSAELLDVPLYGARIVGAADFAIGPVHPHIELAQTFVPFPVDTHIGLNLDWQFLSVMVIHVGGDFDLRTARVEADGGGVANQLGWYITAHAGTGWYF